MNPNDPAFMVIGTYAEGSNALPTGLSKREYFAAMAMQGLLASFPDQGLDGLNCKRYAIAMVEMADALIAELSKGETK